MIHHAATLTIVRDDTGEHIVVTDADDVIWLADDLWRDICDPNRQHIPGGPITYGDVLTFGTPGEGDGRLTYRLAGRNAEGWHVFARITEETA